VRIHWAANISSTARNPARDRIGKTELTWALGCRVASGRVEGVAVPPGMGATVVTLGGAVVVGAGPAGTAARTAGTAGPIQHSMRSSPATAATGMCLLTAFSLSAGRRRPAAP
jgi:hypothetical protein